MIIETIKLSTARIQLEEMSTPDGTKQRTIRLLDEPEGLWSQSYPISHDGFPLQLSHPAHHWSRDAIEWLKYLNPKLMAEYLVKIPSKTVCFMISVRNIAAHHSGATFEDYQQALMEAMSLTTYPLKSCTLEHHSHPLAWVVLGESESLETRYGEMESFLNLLSQLYELFTEGSQLERFPESLKQLIREVYPYPVESWLTFDFMDGLYPDEGTFLMDLVNGVSFESLMATYCHQDD